MGNWGGELNHSTDTKVPVPESSPSGPIKMRVTPRVTPPTTPEAFSGGYPFSVATAVFQILCTGLRNSGKPGAGRGRLP
jgi:hypothetical protein